MFGTIPTTIPDTTPVITPPTTQTDTTVIPIEIPILAPTIPPSPDYTPASLDYSPSDTESNPSKDPSSDHIPSLPAISPFLSLTNDTTNDDTPNTPPSPTHAPGQPIPYGRPYRYHPNGPVHMITMRKRVGLIHVQQLAVRHFVNHSSSDYFSPDDSARNSSSDSSLEATSDFHLDASSDSSSRHSLLDHSSPDLPSSSAGPSCKRRRSLMTSVPTLQPVSGALSLICADLIPSPKRVRDSSYLVDVRVDPRRTSLRDDVIIKGSDEPHLEQDIDLEIQVEIDECFAYADALRDRGLMLEFHDHIEAIPVHRIQVIEGVQCRGHAGDIGRLVHEGNRIFVTWHQSADMLERIKELERDNMRLRDMIDVASQRVTRSQHRELRVQMEMRQIWRFTYF
ncbi:hypothetical protein Tco_0611300 [Tanacetum coccineum]